MFGVRQIIFIIFIDTYSYMIVAFGQPTPAPSKTHPVRKYEPKWESDGWYSTSAPTPWYGDGHSYKTDSNALVDHDEVEADADDLKLKAKASCRWGYKKTCRRKCIKAGWGSSWGSPPRCHNVCRCVRRWANDGWENKFLAADADDTNAAVAKPIEKFSDVFASAEIEEKYENQESECRL